MNTNSFCCNLKYWWKYWKFALNQKKMIGELDNWLLKRICVWAYIHQVQHVNANHVRFMLSDFSVVLLCFG